MNDWRKACWWTVLSFWASLALAAPPPLPLAGDLTDQSGQPLNETVTLTFSLSDSANGNELWSEVHDDVSVVQGRFAVLLGAKKDLLNSDGTAMDFTQKKYIKVQVTRKDQQEPYTLTPPLDYIPTLGAWQAKHAVQADNAAKLDGHGWNEIQTIKHDIEKIERNVSILKANNGNIGDIRYSILSPDSFVKENGQGWVLMDGRLIPETAKLCKDYRICKLPDARGYFIRSLNPDNSQRVAGDAQTDQFKAHKHHIASLAWSTGAVTMSPLVAFDNKGNGYPARLSVEDGPPYGDITGDLIVSDEGGEETRPANIGLYTYIKIDDYNL